MKISRAAAGTLLVVGIGLLAQTEVVTMKLESSAFAAGAAIPRIHSYGAENQSPPLAWSGVPGGTKSLALICDDPDAPRAGGWVHWVLWDMPAGASSLRQGLPPESPLPDGTRQGLNDWRKIGWGGPQPPSGVHHYVFKIYALDRTLGAARAFTRDELLKAMAGHILGQGELVGTFAAR